MMDWFLGELVYSKKGSVLIGSELGLGFFFLDLPFVGGE